MHIAHVSDSYLPTLGGIETQVARLATRQAAAGHRVRVITTTRGADGRAGLSTEMDAGVVVHRIAAPRAFGALPVHPQAASHVAAIMRTKRPDIVHLHMGTIAPTTQLGLREVVRLQIPAVLTVHSIWGHVEHLFAAAERALRLSRWPVVWSAVSELAAAPLRRVVGDAAVLPNAIDVAEWLVPDRDPYRVAGGVAAAGSAASKSAAAASAASTGNADLEPVHVVTASRFAPRKRMLPLLHALADAAHHLPAGSLRVTIAGEGKQLKPSREFVASSVLNGIVNLPGRLDLPQLQALYASAHVFAAPAILDSFGIAALEARAAGLAIVSRSQSGIAERITPGVDGLLADDDAGLAQAIIRLVNDRVLLSRILAHNRDHPPTEDWAVVLADVEAAYTRAQAKVVSG